MSKIKQETYDQYDRYYKGRMSLEEQKSFESKLEEDSSIKKEYDQYLNDQILIKELAKEKLKDKARLLLENEIQTTPPENKGITWKLWIGIVSLILAALIAAVFFFNKDEKQTPQQLYASHFELLQPSFQRSTSGEEALFEKAMTFYVEGEYQKAILALQSLDLNEAASGQVNSDRINLFLGISHMANNDHEEAIIALGKVSRKSIYFDDALWYEALCNLNISYIGRTKEILEELIAKNHYKSEDAKVILDNLNVF